MIAQNNSDSKKEDKKAKKKAEQVVLPEESKVGKKLSDLTTRRVIILVLAMLFSVPIFSTSTYMQDPDTYDYSVAYVSSFNYTATPEMFNITFNQFVKRQSTIGNKLVYANISGLIYQDPHTNADILRDNEQQIAYGTNSFDDLAIYDLRKSTKLQAGLSIGTTFFVCIILASGALLFSNTA